MLTDGWSQAGSFPSWRELCVCGSGCHGNEHRNAKLKTKLAPHRARVCVCVWGNKRNYEVSSLFNVGSIGGQRNCHLGPQSEDSQKMIAYCLPCKLHIFYALSF